MKLTFGATVQKAGRRVGRVAGFELEPAERRIRRVVYSGDGELGPQVLSHPVPAIASVAPNGDVELQTELDIAPMPAVRDVVLLSRATRIERGGRVVGRLTGIDVDQADRRLVSVSGRSHWWSRTTTFPASDLDCSTPGVLRSASPPGSRAA